MKRSRSEHDAFGSQSREGYYAGPDAITDSNADDVSEPRIQLHAAFGESRSGGAAVSWSLSELPAEKVAEQMSGLSGRYTGKTCIVTGGGRGIGEGCVRVFFEAGANVCIADRDLAGATALCDELNKRTTTTSQRAVAVRTDVSVTAELEQLVATTVDTFGRIDCVINNAGWHPPHKAIDDFSSDDMQNLMQLNFISAFALCKFALPHVRKVEGNIINISSFAGTFGQGKACTYAATKGALTSFTKALAIDEAAHRVRVNAVAPGNIWTPLWKAGADADADPVAAREAGERSQAMGRMGSILETGRLCLCIAADLTFTTGVEHLQTGGAEVGYGLKPGLDK